MPKALTTIVTFQSELFNKREPRDYFINPDCYGDDVCKFLIEKLRTKGIECDGQPKQEDWGWLFQFKVDGLRYAFNCSLRRDWPAPPDQPEEPWDEAWIGFVESREGGLLSIVGIGKKEIQIEATKQIHEVLRTSTGITSIMWHRPKDFDAGNEDLGLENPE